MWLPQGGALKIENLQFTQYSIIMLARSYTHSLSVTASGAHRHTQTHSYSLTVDGLSSLIADCGNSIPYFFLLQR